MSIPTETCEVIFEHYTHAMRWMVGHGIQLRLGRTSHYERIIRHWNDVYKSASADEGRQIVPDFVSSMFEIFDFVSLHNAFKGLQSAQLTPIIAKLQKGVNGPINAADETPSSTAARNFLFEAVVAAKAHRPGRGANTIFDARSDTGIRLNGKKIWVEYKRVTTVERIESNVRKASSQLETILAGKVGSGHRGIVALDVSKILDRGDKIFVTRNDDELMSSVDRMMDQFIAEHSHIWQRVYERRHKKIIGTIIRFAFMASSEDRSLLVHASQWAMNPRLGVAASDDQLQRQLVATLATSP